MKHSRIITFLSDFGLRDGTVGICHGVMHGVAPNARVIDIAHDMPAFQVMPAAYLLRVALPYFDVGVHVAVVDPGVGTERRALALKTGNGRFLVGPDNGLLMPAALEAGGVTEAVEISNSPFRNDQVSKTFHGRDIFCPVSAHLALGKKLHDVGEPFDPSDLTDLRLPGPTVCKGSIEASAVFSDRFGNVALSIDGNDMSGAGFSLNSHLDIDIGGETHQAVWRAAFDEAEAGELILFEDSFGAMSIAITRGSAETTLNIVPVCKVKLRIPRG